MRCLITGASGFVGTWLVKHLQAQGDEITVLSPEIDLADIKTITENVESADPQVIYHLAAHTHVGTSWEMPETTFQVNVMGTLGLLEIARKTSRPPRVLLVSSAEVYGPGSGALLDESAPLRPVTPYAASKVAAEFAGLQEYLGRGLEVIRVRPFNHVGPGQSDAFVVSALARRIVEAERSGIETIRVGNLDAKRDFTDVRDVVRAYRMLAESGVAGEVYNVCSGEAVAISALLEELVTGALSKVTPVVDPSLFRPIDVASVVGDCSALKALTGWNPEFSRQETLRDVLSDWREQLDQA